LPGVAGEGQCRDHPTGVTGEFQQAADAPGSAVPHLDKAKAEKPLTTRARQDRLRMAQ
jgi:hypothetical protein